MKCAIEEFKYYLEEKIDNKVFLTTDFNNNAMIEVKMRKAIGDLFFADWMYADRLQNKFEEGTTILIEQDIGNLIEKISDLIKENKLVCSEIRV
ncbi:hypothetical protein GLW05_20940 [Pontibacillus yanchengensis]|uniref:Uncharacterized protein n=1 Tax=Pontibacillus yanchengensis TaxID=462910 RepID=A0A6I5A6L9_9BACI|nr:hypothetical protein [Pontibacillus yanchengensis]MYL36041.1 hypothetical protein [Pontibacillus yanchengensis]